MSTRTGRFVGALGALILACGIVSTPTAAQTFGRSKVQYDHFDFRTLNTPHYAVYFYPAESLATADAARMAERWYTRHSSLLNHTFTGSPLIFYADAPDFQQSNVVEGLIGIGTGGITEGARERVIMPYTGIYADNDHVLGHELVHVFQYRMAEGINGGSRNIGQIPLWLIEGMAEYLSIGREDANTAMWLRDATRRNDLPSIEQLTNDPSYFPYRYGQALWAYIGGRWGDPMVNQLFRAALKEGWEKALVSQLKLDGDGLSREWHAAIRQQYADVLRRQGPDSIGRPIIVSSEAGDQNVSPAVSPDGQLVAYFSSRNLFGIDLYVADANTGRVIRQLTDITSNPHFDALSFISSGGGWSPDGQRIAVVTYAQGDNEINVLNARSGRVEQRIRVDGIGGMADPAWSPDGSRIAFSGQRGGISDLYVYELATRRTTQLTNDREAQIQPVWSNDGRRIAYATDADAATSFDALTFAPLRLAVVDVSSRQVQLIPRLGRGKSINPQFTQSGDALLFVSDQDGVSDVYRYTLGSGVVTRVTESATGVSGISSASPAISVARNTGDLVFSIFDRGGFSIRRLPAAETIGRPVNATLAAAPAAAVLPPPSSQSLTGMANGVLDLPPAAASPTWLSRGTTPYKARLGLDFVGGASVGASVGGGFGSGLAGGVVLGFSDMLGNHNLTTVIQANGSFQDIGGQLQHINRERRLNWGAYAQHVPLVGAYAGYEPTVVNIGNQEVQGTVVTRLLQRQFFDDAQAVLQYPLSSTRRFELSAGGQRISYGLQVDSIIVVGDQVLDQVRRNLRAPGALTFATGTAAFVGDYSFFGFTSPVAGGRYRFEVAPYAGSLTYQTLLADYRRYFFKRPFTLAIRGLHFGRYGADAEDPRMQQLFVGQPTLLRGYDPQSFRASECSDATPGDGQAVTSCPELTRLQGSRVGAASVELRIPLFGVEQLGLFNVPFLPIEIAPFADAGVAWNSGDTPSWRFDQNTAARVPVFSAGVTARVSLFGAAVVEVFWAHPFQRPQRNGVFGFQLAPGW